MTSGRGAVRGSMFRRAPSIVVVVAPRGCDRVPFEVQTDLARDVDEAPAAFAAIQGSSLFKTGFFLRVLCVLPGGELNFSTRCKGLRYDSGGRRCVLRSFFGR